MIAGDVGGVVGSGNFDRSRQLLRSGERLLAGGDRAGEPVLLELGEDRAQPRAGCDAGLADELVAAHQRRRDRLAAAAMSSRATSRCASIAGSAFLPRVARRSATVKIVVSAL